ncbi:MAG TPA: hypothetical protein VGA24_10805 [Steroidobacteraceae bacterium]
MNNAYSTRSRTWVSALAAVAVTTALVSSLVESFDPEQLIRIEEKSAPAQIAVLDTRDKAIIREA